MRLMDQGTCKVLAAREMVLLWWKALKDAVQICSVSRVSGCLTAERFYVILEQALWGW